MFIELLTGMITCTIAMDGEGLLQFSGKNGEVFNLLWVLVFGFATLNILGLTAKRFEGNRRGLSPGELLAVLVVCVSVGLLVWEMLNLFKIFPIRLHVG